MESLKLIVAAAVALSASCISLDVVISSGEDGVSIEVVVISGLPEAIFNCSEMISRI